MARIIAGLVAVVTAALLGWPSVAPAQTKPDPYRPLTNAEMSEQGIWNQWVTTFNEMTPKQRAEVMRRHIKMCLDSFELTDEQRTFVKDFTAKFVTEAAYGTTDPEKRAALQRDMQPLQEKAMSLLGPDLARKFFFAKPPISVLEAVKNDPAFKQMGAAG
jgi:hypothetical protein